MSNFEGISGFYVTSIILVKGGRGGGGGGVRPIHKVTYWPSLADNESRHHCSRIAKEIAIVSGFFCQRKEADVALFLQVTRIRKIRKSPLLTETGRSK